MTAHRTQHLAALHDCRRVDAPAGDELLAGLRAAAASGARTFAGPASRS